MRFKIDENVPIEAAELLNEAGHDATTVYDEGLAGISDPRLFDTCQSEGRTLLTLDLDFADIRHYPPQEHGGIVVLRPRIQEKDHIVQLILHLIDALTIEQVEKRLWVIDESGLRVRGGPEG